MRQVGPATAGEVWVVAALVCVTGVLAAPAAAKTIHVRAKQEDAIAKALRRAHAGDRLAVHRGTYDERVVVNKRVRIVGHKKKGRRRGRKPVIDPGCGPSDAFDVTAAGAKLRRLKIRGGNVFTLDMSRIERGTARQVRVIDECDAEYGINVFDGGAIRLFDNRASGYVDAGIYIGAITDTGAGELLVSGNEAYGNNRGLIVEDSAGADIRVARNRFHDNRLPGHGAPSGILVNRSDGVTFSGNVVEDNTDFGIDLTLDSDFNRLFDNVFRRNGTNVRDLGFGNCGSGNSPNSFPPC